MSSSTSEAEVVLAQTGPEVLRRETRAARRASVSMSHAEGLPPVAAIETSLVVQNKVMSWKNIFLHSTKTYKFEKFFKFSVENVSKS